MRSLRILFSLACVLLAGALPSESAALSPAHRKAAARKRRVVVQLDGADHRRANLPPEEWLRYMFAYTNQQGSQIDSIFWDIGLDNDSAVYPSKILPPNPDLKLQQWRRDGFEWVGALIAESRKRNIEVFWNHRFSEVDIAPDGKLELRTLHPMKAEHPDWLIRSWWWQGLWNAASPGVRDMKVRQLRELVENYELDGVQIDFARHIPCLPPGHQWENREGVTELLRVVRRMLLDVERQRGRPLLLSVKVPQNLKGAHADGFDIETWAKEELVDLLTLGSRTMDVDIEGYRRVTAKANIKLLPCFDDHHATDGYRFAPIEFLRGVFSNWWRQGADGVTTFNWGVAPPDWTERAGDGFSPATHGEAYNEIGDPEAMRWRSKLFAVERRGGYPWSEGYFNRNDDAPLPVILANDGRISEFPLRISDDLRAAGPKLREATLRLVLFRAAPGDRLEVKLNGVPLPESRRDLNWKDAQIFSPNPQPNSGGGGSYKVDPARKLMLLVFRLDPEQARIGVNNVSVRVISREPFAPGINIQIEKIEAAVDYLPGL